MLAPAYQEAIRRRLAVPLDEGPDKVSTLADAVRHHVGAGDSLGIFCLAAGLQGWLRRRATPLDRALLVTAAILLVIPNAMADLGGLLLLGLTWGLQSLRRGPEIAPAPAPSLD
ncbi:MAG: hypothetical protein ACREJE_10685 [Candidatus Rokuibacteriota bacterium]